MLKLQSGPRSVAQQPVQPMHICVRSGMLMLWAAKKDLRMLACRQAVQS